MALTEERYRWTRLTRKSISGWLVPIRTGRLCGQRTDIVHKQLHILPVALIGFHPEPENFPISYPCDNSIHLCFTVELSQSKCTAATVYLQYKLNIYFRWTTAAAADVVGHTATLSVMTDPFQFILVFTNEAILQDTVTSRFDSVVTGYGHLLVW